LQPSQAQDLQENRSPNELKILLKLGSPLNNKASDTLPTKRNGSMASILYFQSHKYMIK
jgi:hypothetical protein